MSLLLKISWAIYGWIFCNALLFWWYKEKYDDGGKLFTKENAWAYILKYYDNWIISLLFIPIMIAFGPSLHEAILYTLKVWFGWDINLPWNDWMYMSGTAILEFFIFKVKEYIRKQNSG